MATKTYTIRSGFYEDPIETIYDFIILKMFEDTLFIDYNQAKKTRHTNQTEQYTPWYDEYQDYSRHPTYFKGQLPVPSKLRYASEMDTYTSKSRIRTIKIKEPKENEPRISIQKTVTIQYQDDRFLNNKNKEEEKRNRIRLKLPILTPKKRQKKEESISVEKDGYLLKNNNRNSLKKYVHNSRIQVPTPHFEIYKRSIVAARLSLARDPGRSLQLYNNI